LAVFTFDHVGLQPPKLNMAVLPVQLKILAVP